MEDVMPQKHGLKRTFEQHQQLHGEIETAYTLSRKQVKTNGLTVQGIIPHPTLVSKPAPAPAPPLLSSYGMVMGEPGAQTIVPTTSQDTLPAAEMPLSPLASLQILEAQHAKLLLTCFGVTSPAAAMPNFIKSD